MVFLMLMSLLSLVIRYLQGPTYPTKKHEPECSRLQHMALTVRLAAHAYGDPVLFYCFCFR